VINTVFIYDYNRAINKTKITKSKNLNGKDYGVIPIE